MADAFEFDLKMISDFWNKNEVRILTVLGEKGIIVPFSPNLKHPFFYLCFSGFKAFDLNWNQAVGLIPKVACHKILKYGLMPDGLSIIQQIENVTGIIAEKVMMERAIANQEYRH